MSLKDFKSAFKLGDTWEVFNSNGWKNSDSKIRITPVGLVQSNAVAFRTESGALSWLYWPKASELTVIDNVDHIAYRIENPVMGGYLIYKKVKDEK